MKPDAGEVTRLLQAWHAGDEDAYRLVSAILYDELRRQAVRCMRGERPGITLQATALVHEAFMRLAGAGEVDWQDRKHFLAIAARTMRRVLVDLVRPNYEQGQLTSLIAALRRIDRSAVSGALVTLIDVPLVSADTVRRLMAAHRTLAASIVRPVSNGRHGHPVIFHSRLFDELERADPAGGAKPVVHAHAADVFEVTVQDEGAFIDIDTREDYERWIGPLTSGSVGTRE